MKLAENPDDVWVFKVADTWRAISWRGIVGA